MDYSLRQGLKSLNLLYAGFISLNTEENTSIFVYYNNDDLNNQLQSSYVLLLLYFAFFATWIKSKFDFFGALILFSGFHEL